MDKMKSMYVDKNNIFGNEGKVNSNGMSTSVMAMYVERGGGRSTACVSNIRQYEAGT